MEGGISDPPRGLWIPWFYPLPQQPEFPTFDEPLASGLICQRLLDAFWSHVWKFTFVWIYFTRQPPPFLPQLVTLSYVLLSVANLLRSQREGWSWRPPCPSRLIHCAPTVLGPLWARDPCVRDWMFVAPQSHMLKPNPQCDSTRRWGLWEVVSWWGWSPRLGLAPWKETTDG